MTENPPGVSLGSLLRAWADAGEAPPAAIVAGIVHDLSLEVPVTGTTVEEADVDQIFVDAEGLVHAGDWLGLPALGGLLDSALSGNHSGRTGDLMPPQARAGLDRFERWDGDRRDGLEALRCWLRESFGPLPAPEEVARCCIASAPLDPQGATIRPVRIATDITVEPEPLEPPSEVPSVAPTEIGSSDVAENEHEPARAPEGQTAPADESSSDLWELSPDGNGKTERPVVRKAIPRAERPVSVGRAPAARRSARPLSDQRDSILVPADAGSWRSWLLLLFGIGVAVAVYFVLTA